MASVKLLLAVVFALLAFALAHPSRSNGGPQNDGQQGGAGGWGRSDGQGGAPGGQGSDNRNHEQGPGAPDGSHEGDHGKECGVPDWANNFDNDTQSKLAEVWKNYVSGTNCTGELIQQDTIIKAAFQAQMDAKAANLTATQKAVYDQFKAAFTAFDALSAEDKAALQALMPQRGKGGFGGDPKGPKNGSHERSGN